jgi:hypothetical protein
MTIRAIQFLWLLCCSGPTLGQSAPDPSSAAIARARESCYRSYGLEDKKILRRLMPLFDLVPLPLDYGDMTEPMLHLNRKPSAAEKQALSALYDAELACTQAGAKMLNEIGNEKYEQDPITGIPKGWEQTFVRIHLLMDGKLTYAQFNRARQEDIDKATAAGAKALAEITSRANPNPALLSALDDWYRQALGNCGSDDDCKRIMETAYENGVACARGSSKACSDQESDKIAIERWNAQRAARSQNNSADTLMNCLQDAADRVVAACKQSASAKNTTIAAECPAMIGTIRLMQQTRCGYSAIESRRLPDPPAFAPIPGLQQYAAPPAQPRVPQVDPACLSNLQVEKVPEGQARAMCTH